MNMFAERGNPNLGSDCFVVVVTLDNPKIKAENYE